MHNLAIALHKKGAHVTGSDDYIFEPSKSQLERYNLLPQNIGWHPEVITEDIDFVVLGMHARKDNPELLRAQELDLKIYSFPEFVYERVKEKTRVVIAGSHGKTTVASMVLHILKYMSRDEDYLVGAHLKGYETMVNLTEIGNYAILEGDEYPSSPIDPRPKFLHYHPNIALITGIAWDHVNMFPSFETYVEQFELFTKSIVNGGVLIYNSEDNILKALVEKSSNHIRKIPYSKHPHKIVNDITQIETPIGFAGLEIFGAHNMSNLSATKWICQQIGINEEDFYEAILSFKGASKRLECIFRNEETIVFKDFAHSPSKVKATVEAVKSQYSGRKLIAFLELHTYSSLSKEFIGQYRDCLKNADETVVFYLPETLSIKKLEPLSPKEIEMAFNHHNMSVFEDSKYLQNFIARLDHKNMSLLFMSSGNFGGIDLKGIIRNIATLFISLFISL
ncbi:UDP-N-acetylmuramate--L-alanine ligase [Elysia marginata]|uniref:UDP-N-acetylmuramate--L-alanine ligase n=1 Tax=Elysia marginata TaxID=1093978 RepID=A0AAV4GJ05_9GAST|nr:UDP-N-acetylmuramate--L-alanine ligase [Elysia marginata]